MISIDEVIKAHGNPGNWNQYNRIITTLSFGGLAFQMKFNNTGIKERRYFISLDSPMVVIENYPKPQQQGIFTPEIVWIESFDGKKIKERRNPRSTFKKWPHRFFWDDLDLLYFAAYACWNYFNTPFLFANEGFKFNQLSDWQENGHRLYRFEALFPEEIPAHCRKQVFYFDELLRISRFDYNPEVFASWAKATHYCYDYQNFNDIWLPTKRRVVPRRKDGGAAAGPTLVWIEVKKLHFQ